MGGRVGGWVQGWLGGVEEEGKSGRVTGSGLSLPTRSPIRSSTHPPTHPPTHPAPAGELTDRPAPGLPWPPIDATLALINEPPLGAGGACRGAAWGVCVSAVCLPALVRMRCESPVKMALPCSVSPTHPPTTRSHTPTRPGANVSAEDDPADPAAMLCVAAVPIPAGAELFMDYGLQYDRSAYGGGGGGGEEGGEER